MSAAWSSICARSASPGYSYSQSRSRPSPRTGCDRTQVVRLIDVQSGTYDDPDAVPARGTAGSPSASAGWSRRGGSRTPRCAASTPTEPRRRRMHVADSARLRGRGSRRRRMDRRQLCALATILAASTRARVRASALRPAWPWSSDAGTRPVQPLRKPQSSPGCEPYRTRQPPHKGQRHRRSTAGACGDTLYAKHSRLPIAGTGNG